LTASQSARSQQLKDRRTRRLQTLFGTVEVEAPRFKVCRCRVTAPLPGVTSSPSMSVS